MDKIQKIRSAVYTAVGAGSVCWENMSGTGVFQDDLARKAADSAIDEIINTLITNPVEVTSGN